MKLPRFQFRLRTLMIAVTLLAAPLGYVGWQATIVRERKAMLTELTIEYVSGDFPGIYNLRPPKYDVSIVRKWLGDRAYPCILLPRGLPESKLADIQAMFPESHLINPDDIELKRPPQD